MTEFDGESICDYINATSTRYHSRRVVSLDQLCNNRETGYTKILSRRTSRMGTTGIGIVHSLMVGGIPGSELFGGPESKWKMSPYRTKKSRSMKRTFDVTPPLECTLLDLRCCHSSSFDSPCLNSLSTTRKL